MLNLVLVSSTTLFLSCPWRLRYHVLLFVRRARSLTSQSGPYVRYVLSYLNVKMIEITWTCFWFLIFDFWFLINKQGMACRPNTHRPSFHVNMVGLEKNTQRSNSSRFPWDLDVEMMDEDEEELELWLQQALASGLFCETSKRRKSWSPFKLSQMKSKKQWRRTSTWWCMSLLPKGTRIDKIEFTQQSECKDLSSKLSL